MASLGADEAGVRGFDVVFGETHAAAHAKLQKLAFHDLPSNFVAVLLRREARLAGLFDEALDRETLLAGHVFEPGVDLFGRDREVRLLGSLLLDALVDHALEKLLEHLGFGRRLLGTGRHPLLNLKEERPGTLPHVAQQNRVLAHHRNHALGHHSVSQRRHGQRHRSHSKRPQAESELHVEPSNTSPGADRPGQKFLPVRVPVPVPENAQRFPPP